MKIALVTDLRTLEEKLIGENAEEANKFISRELSSSYYDDFNVDEMREEHRDFKRICLKLYSQNQICQEKPNEMER
jgi:hypothetical protein